MNTIPTRGGTRAPVEFHGSIWIEAEPEAVWRWISDVATWPAWHHGVTAVGVNGAMETGRPFHWRVDGMQIHSVATRVEPPARLEWTTRGMGLRGVQRWSLDPEGEGTRVRLQESLGGWIPFLLRATVRKTVRVSRDAWLQALRARVERTSP